MRYALRQEKRNRSTPNASRYRPGMFLTFGMKLAGIARRSASSIGLAIAPPVAPMRVGSPFPYAGPAHERTLNKAWNEATVSTANVAAHRSQEMTFRLCMGLR